MTQPFGFASPVAPPLSVAPEPARLPEVQAPPTGYAAPAEPQPPLAAIAPAPLAQRNPTTPFVDELPEVASEAQWQPHEPLPTSAPLGTSAVNSTALVDPATLPPPTGMPLQAAPQHQAAASPYGPNPYATGPYSAPTPYGYPAPYGPPGGAPGPRPPVTIQQVFMAANPYVLGLLVVGALWPQVAAYALLAAVAVALLRGSPGRVLVAASGGLALVITLVWFMGYIGNSQWQSTSQLLSLVSLIGVPLITYQQLRH